MFSSASVARPPSPEWPSDPVPATVVMIPSRPTRRIRSLPVSGDVEASVPAQGDVGWLVQLGCGGRAAAAGEPPNSVARRCRRIY
jgi:hypothetical protein